MPSNPRQKASNAQASADAPQTRQRNAPKPKQVTFENEQGNAAVTAANTAADKARQKKEQEKAKMAQIKANAAAAKRALQEQQAAMRRYEKEEATRRKDEEIRVRRLEAEMEALRRDKDVELERLRAAAAAREEEKRQEAERRLRQSTDEALHEFNLEAEAPTPRSLARIKQAEEQKNGPYDYSVKAVLRVQNGSQILTKWHNKIGGVHRKGSFDIHALNLDLDAAMEGNGVNELVEIKGWVRSSHGRASRQTFTMNSISIEQWEQRVESITTAEWQKYVNYIIDVEITCTGRIGLRRPIQDVDGATQSPSHRRTRTTRLEEQHAVVRDRNEALGENAEKLITRWTCHDAICGHKGICWVDDTGEHHKMNAVMRERWAAAWQNDQASELVPPLSLIKRLINQSSGGDNQSSQRGRKPSAMDQMRDMLHQHMELNMMKSMKSLANESQQPQQSQQYYAPAPPPPPPPPAYPHTISYPPPPHGGYMQQIQQPGVIATPSPSPTPTSRAQRAPEPQQVTLQQRSSPIGMRSEEEDIIDSFWQWKKEATNKASKKLQICQTQAKFDHECWGLDDMKAMADTSSEVYKLAVSAGLPQGLIRGLKADLKEFKGLWRETYQHARTLNNLGQQGGGFE